MYIGPTSSGDNIKTDNSLAARLSEYPRKRWKIHEAHKIISEFLLTPHLPVLIENLNKVHRIDIDTANGGIYKLKLQYEKDKRRGWWYSLKRFFSPYETGVTIWHNGQLFLCEYYKHSLFSICDKMKNDYDASMKSVLNYDFVVVDRTK